MDRKTSRGIGYSSMGSRLTGKTSSLQDDSSRCCNQTRCSAGLCSTVIKGTDNIAKLKTLTTFSSNGFSIGRQNPQPVQVNQPLPQSRVITKRIKGKIKTDVSKCTLKQLPSCSKAVNSAVFQNLSEDRTEILDTCSTAILSKATKKQIKQRPGNGGFYAPTVSSTLRLIASKDAKKAVKSCSQGAGTGAKKCNLRNNSCPSISEAIPSVCSHSISVPSRRDAMASRIYLDGESSTSRTKSTSASSNRKLSGSLNTRLSTAITLKASSMPNTSKINGLLTVAKPLEHSRRGTTKGLPAKGNPRISLREHSSLEAAGSSSRSVNNELSPTCHSVSGRRNFIRRNAPGRPTYSPALGSMLTLCDPLAKTDAHTCNNIEGIVLPSMMLERAEHNQEQTYEHMFESESNLSLGRLNCDDQHREMRMDIDNMSYEELVELVEKIGSVSTGLTDEALTKCLKRSNFKLAHSVLGFTDCVEDGNRCSICQEECADGDEIGTLACEHCYHVVCIQQWLKQKNWCPICKSPACVTAS